MASSSSCAWAYGLLLTGPALSWIYAVVVLIFLWAWHECTLDSMTKPISIRTAFFVAALAVCLTRTCEQQDLTVVVPVGIILSLISVWFIYQTRVYEIEGGPPPTLEKGCMKGKVVLVTGANAGIGKETVRQLAALDATVILACRSEARATAAMDDVRASLSNDVDLRFLPLDLSDLSSVRQAAQLFLDWNLPLHVLINNAGVMMGQKQTTKDGFELMMLANHLGHFLLQMLLLPKLQESKEGRIVTVTSSTYGLAKQGFDFDDMFCDSSRTYTLFGQYAQTKLANILVAKESARRYPNVLSFAVHPGLVRTDVVRNMPWYLYYPNYIFGAIIAALQKQPQQGAYTSVYCAAAKAPAENGSYLVNCKVQETTKHANSKEDAKRLWEVSEELVQLKR